MADKKMEAQISVEFEEATSRQSLNSGETINTLWGKVKRWLSDLKSVCFSGSYNDLSDRPTTATTDTDGLMSASDKSKLDDADNTYALKSKYGDTTINVGRKDGSDTGEYSTAEGYNTTASGYCSHAEGRGTIASSFCSHAGGYNTTALHNHEVAYGRYNESNNNTLFSIGDGTADDARHNAFEITTTGGKLHDKDIATIDLIPSSLPANGGNADTLDGKQASDFIYARGYFDNIDLDDIKYPCSGLALDNCTHIPSNVWGTLLVYTGGTGSFTQIYISTEDDAAPPTTMYFRHHGNTRWSDWKEISTTPIKSTTFGITTNENGWIDTGLPVDTTKIMSVLCSTKSIIGHVWQLDGYSTWCASFYNTAVLSTPLVNTPVSFTIYYIEI